MKTDNTNGLLITIENLKEKVEHYHGIIEKLQLENAEQKDLIQSLENKIRIKSLWSKIWAALVALLTALLALKIYV